MGMTDHHIFGYQFNTPALLQQALTHRSFINEQRQSCHQDYQRLEFLGDAVLGMILADVLFSNFPGFSEGRLSQMRASLVDQPRLAALAKETGLPELVLLGRGAELEGGRANASILSDVFEATIGAIYLDGGFQAAYQVVCTLYTPLLHQLTEGQLHYDDPKSALQELLATRKLPPPTYRLDSQHGPDHDRWFSIEVLCAERVLGKGIGRSKKAAQQAAATDALSLLHSCDNNEHS